MPSVEFFSGNRELIHLEVADSNRSAMEIYVTADFAGNHFARSGAAYVLHS